MRFIAIVTVTASMSAMACGRTHLDGQSEEQVVPRAADLALSKSDFLDSDWYLRQVFVDVPNGAVRGFDGLATDVEKVRWEVTEKHLVA
jgi:hypothetical protein